MPPRREPTVALLEIASVARGVLAADRLLKEASVRVLFARPVSPGKHLILFTGSVDDATSALRVGAEAAGELLVDSLLLPAVHDGVLDALARPVRAPPLDAVGVIETWTAAAAIRAADAAAKRAAVTPIELRLAQGLGGKSYVTLTGEVADVEAAVDAGALPEEERGLLVARVVIPRPHGDLADLLGRHDEAIPWS